MSVSAHTPRRATFALGLAVATILAAAVPAVAGQPLAAVRVPVAVTGASIIVTYKNAATFRAGGIATAATQSGRIDALRVKVFTPRLGKEQLAMRQLADDAGVVSIEGDVPVKNATTPNDSLWQSRQAWAHDRVGLRTAWSTVRGSSGVVIAILDSGVETSHPEFADRVVPGYDFVDNDTTANDPRGHGTMSAGVAAARGNNRIGVAGACWGCGIMPIRVLNERGTGYASSVVKGIIFATDNGADVISMSFGGFAPTTSMASAVDYARSHGVVVVASAGNNGNSTPFYPAALPGVIGVVASDLANRPYSWSNRGRWAELAAPGCFWTTTVGGSYGNFCGTSASAPLVAGIVGLMRSANPSAPGDRIEQALLSTASPLTYVGNGRPNAPEAIKAARAIPAAAPDPVPVPAPAGALNGRTTTSLILRAGPSTTHQALTTLATDTSVMVIGPFVADAEGRTWAPVGVAGQRGFVAAWFADFSGSAATTDNLILRATPSTSATAIVTVPAGTRLTVFGSVGDATDRAWLKVLTLAGQSGYMAAWFIQP